MTRKENLTTKFLDNELTAEDLIDTIIGLEDSLKTYKESRDIDSYIYEMKVDKKGNIPLLIKVNGTEHSIGITERDAKSFVRIFQMSKMR